MAKKMSALNIKKVIIKRKQIKKTKKRLTSMFFNQN